MTAGMAHHLVRRALDITQQQHYSNDGERSVYDIGGWALFAILATVVTYVGVISMVSHLIHSLQSVQVARLILRYY